MSFLLQRFLLLRSGHPGFLFPPLPAKWDFFFLDNRNKSATHFPAASSSLMVKAEYIKCRTWGPTRTVEALRVRRPLAYYTRTNPVRSSLLSSSVLSPKPFYSGTRRPLRNKTAFSVTISLLVFSQIALSLSLSLTPSRSLPLSLSVQKKKLSVKRNGAVAEAHQVIIWLMTFYSRCCSRLFLLSKQFSPLQTIVSAF